MHYGRFPLDFFPNWGYCVLKRHQNCHEKLFTVLSKVCQYLRNQLTFRLSCEKSPPGGSLSPKQLKNGQIQRYLHYWRSPRDKLGTKMIRRNYRNLIFVFPGRPCGFRAARNKKQRKFCHFWLFLAFFERSLASSSSETTWSTWKPKN